MNADLLDRRDAVVMATYGRPSIALTRGAGAHVWDADGREYVDLIAGVAVSVLGHCHPAVRAAVVAQLDTLGHTSNLYVNTPQVLLAERLMELLGVDGRAFFCNSGAEANETAIKISRRTGRSEIIAAEGAFHGRTMGALSITGQPGKRAPFEPLLPGVRFVPYGDAQALAEAVSERTAAVFLEPTLGEGGVVAPPPGYLAAARAACDEHGALLVLDEVQSGIGRTGAWFAHQTAGVVPDVITLAKGLGGGLPIGVCIGIGAAGRLLQPGDHGSTFGGGPLVCSAALAVLDTIVADGLLDHATALGESLRAGILAAGAAGVTGVRGVGLWRAIELDGPWAAELETAAREAGFLVNAVAADVVRLAPPLVITQPDVDAFVSALPGITAGVLAGRGRAEAGKNPGESSKVSP
ncbi:acetylornithine aminotransferase [Parafrankia irregularis]|uniref:Acetylornithine aminotransferase n=1 Tax=Parafrankia irregularis TaxID=795642 RepID=A0A0S4R1E2_9ACTN|nr:MULTISPECIES: acetylornithine transaminase [Parafrankia]MBE3206295.1 acetylornithine transaminase [Parafrankia sp. CH37]CUU61020.1 acetylornithine aminotransferase [Parafrankia irregularis]